MLMRRVEELMPAATTSSYAAVAAASSLFGHSSAARMSEIAAAAEDADCCWTTISASPPLQPLQQSSISLKQQHSLLQPFLSPKQHSMLSPALMLEELVFAEEGEQALFEKYLRQRQSQQKQQQPQQQQQQPQQQSQQTGQSSQLSTLNIGIALKKNQSRSDENDNNDNNNNNNNLNVLEYNRTREKELQQPSHVFTDVTKTAAAKGRPRTYSVESHFGMRDPQTEFSQWMCDDPMWWNENLHIQIDSDEDPGATSAAEKDFSEDIFSLFPFPLSISSPPLSGVEVDAGEFTLAAKPGVVVVDRAKDGAAAAAVADVCTVGVVGANEQRRVNNDFRFRGSPPECVFDDDDDDAAKTPPTASMTMTTMTTTTTKTSTTKAETTTSMIEKVQIPLSSSSSPPPPPSSSSSSLSSLHPGSFIAVAASFPDLIFPEDELKRAVDRVVAVEEEEEEEEEEEGAMVIGGAIRQDDCEDDNEDDNDDDDDDVSVEGDMDDGVSLFSGEEGAAEMALEMMIAMEIDVGAESQISGVGIDAESQIDGVGVGVESGFVEGRLRLFEETRSSAEESRRRRRSPTTTTTTTSPPPFPAADDDEENATDQPQQQTTLQQRRHQLLMQQQQRQRRQSLSRRQRRRRRSWTVVKPKIHRHSTWKNAKSPTRGLPLAPPTRGLLLAPHHVQKHVQQHVQQQLTFAQSRSNVQRPSNVSQQQQQRQQQQQQQQQQMMQNQTKTLRNYDDDDDDKWMGALEEEPIVSTNSLPLDHQGLCKSIGEPSCNEKNSPAKRSSNNKTVKTSEKRKNGVQTYRTSYDVAAANRAREHLNIVERQRRFVLAQAMDKLRDQLPYQCEDERRKLSKLEILRGAKEFVNRLRLREGALSDEKAQLKEKQKQLAKRLNTLTQNNNNNDITN